MTSSLANQLANIGSVDAARLSVSTSKARPSFLFTPRQAASLSNADIHSLGYNGYLALLSEDPRLERFETPIFGEKAKGTDRALLTPDESAKLDRILGLLLRALAEKFLVRNTGKVLEWCIRRFRINEFNVDDLFAVILPYHETPQFARMLQIMDLKDGKFSSFAAVKTSLQPLPRHHLLTAMTKSHDLLLYISHFVRAYAAEGLLYPTLVGFWTGTLVGYLDRLAAGKIAENQMTVLLPVLTEALQSKTSNDWKIGACILLSKLGPKVELNEDAMELLINALLARGTMDSVTEQQDGLEAVITTLVILCESQRTTLSRFPKKALNNLVRSSDALDILVALSSQHAASKLLHPFLTSLTHFASTEDSTADTSRYGTALHTLLAPVSCPQQVTSIALPILIAKASTASESASPAVIAALSAITQRDAEAYYTACEAAQKGQTAEAKAGIRRVMAAVSGYGLFDTASLTGPSANGEAMTDADLALSLGSNDEQARARALSHILAAVSLGEPNLDERTVSPTLAGIILARLADPSPAVAKTLLESEGGKTILARLIAQEKDKVLAASLSTLADADVPRATAVSHIRYLLTGFLPAINAESRQDLTDQVFQQAIWPRLCATKASIKTWKAVWSLLELQTDALPLLRGCNEIITAQDADNLAPVNEQLATKIAENVAQLETSLRTAFESFLVAGATASSSIAGPASAFSCLVLAKLIQGGSSALISQILPEQLDIAAVSGSTAQLPSPETAAAIYAKPISTKTLSKCLGELRYTALLSIALPGPASSGKWAWLARSDHMGDDARAFVSTARRAYELAHTDGLKQEASTQILASLFTKGIQEDALAFLASVYGDLSSPSKLRTIALRDTALYLQANEAADAGAQFNDFQVVLPSLLVALSDKDRDVRAAVFPALELIAKAAKRASQEQRLYAFDQFYGVDSSKELQYLDPNQTGRYTRLLIEKRAELLLSSDGLRVLHTNRNLDDPEKPSSSKRKAFSHAVFCWLASHALAWQSNLGARAALLHGLRDLVDTSKAAIYRPLLLSAVKASPAEIAAVSPDSVNTYAILLLEVYGTLPKDGLDEDSMKIFLAVFETRNVAALAVAVRKQARERLRLSLFAALTQAQRLHVLERIVLLLLHPVPSEAASLRQLLGALSIDSITFTLFFDKLCLSFRGGSTTDSPDTSIAKKSRSAPGTTISGRANRTAELAVALENIDIKTKVELSKEVLAVLLETLSSLVELQVNAQTDVAYYGQLVMSALTTVVGRMSETAVAVDESVRISPVLEIIRISNNPATSNQALSLIADLVALVPEQVVQNIMPIFTFMGTNVLQRDDAYSSRVVDKTIESIVPALVKYRRKRALSQEQLISELSDFLRVFADAANHVPRHRRNRLFIRFVDVLGPKDFLAPVCGLLVDKVALKFVKTQDATLLALPLALSGHFSADIQLASYHQLLSDLLNKVQSLNVEATDGSIASRQSTPSTPAESPALPINTSRRTILASLTFLNQAISAKQLHSRVDQARGSAGQDLDVTIQDLIKTSTTFYTLTPQKLAEGDIAQLLANVEAFVLSVAKLLTVSAFAEVILWSLNDQDTRVVRMAFDLLLARLRTVKQAKRGDLSDAVVAGAKKLQDYLLHPAAKFERTRSMQILRVLASATTDSETPVLGETLTVVLDNAASEQSKNTLSQYIAFIRETIPRLGARVIPSVGRIVTLAVQLVHKFTSTNVDSASRSIIASSLSAIEALFQAVPTFVSGQLQAVFKICTADSVRQLAVGETTGKIASALSALLSAATKKTASKTLFAAVVQLWDSTDKGNAQAILGNVEILSRALRQSNATAVAETYKQTFALFLAIFDTRRRAVLSAEHVTSVEGAATSAFMQMILRLNEGTFRPLFLRFFDWAVVELADGDGADADGVTSRKIVLFKTVDKMLAQLKSIAVPYYSFMLDQAVQLVSSQDTDAQLLTTVMSTLSRALEHDNSGFWTAARLSKLVTPLAQHIESDNVQDGRLSVPYTALLGAVSQALEEHEQILHDLVKAFLTRTRSEDEDIQLAAVNALRIMWDAGIDASMAAHSAESMPFLVEALETGGQVERATKELLARMNEDQDGAGSTASDDEDASDSDDDGSLGEGMDEDEVE